MPFIAIVSNHPESGDEIARQVAERLEYTYVGDSFVEDIAQKRGTTVKKLRRAMAGDRTLFNAVTHDYEKSVTFIKSALASLLAKDGIVFLGLASYLIPADVGHVLRVGVVADNAYGVEQGVQREGLSAKEAEARVAKRDEELARWVTEQVGKSAWDPSLFDVRVSLPEKSVDEAVELIAQAVTSEALRITDVSIKAAMDFMLAAKVQLALLEEGIYNSRVTADGSKVSVTQVAKPAPAGKITRTVHAMRLESQQDAVVPIAKAVEGVTDVVVHIAAQRPPKTLLVDDEAEYVTTLSERLEMRDIESEVAYDGQQALAAVANEIPEVIVLDLKMPGIDGLEVLRRVKAEHPEVEVIVVTGHGSEHDERTARQLGAFDYLQKPVDIAKLTERINAASAAAHKRAAEKPTEGEE